MSNQAQSNYFDQITSGIGYMKRMRFVEPDKKRGQKFKPFMSVTICGFFGEEGDVSYLQYDVSIKGQQAKDAMEVLKQYLVDKEGKELKNNKVLVGYQIGDAVPGKPYSVENKQTGAQEIRTPMQGRLLKLAYAKVNGTVIDLPKTEHDAAKEKAELAGEAAEDQHAEESDDIPY